MEAVSSAMSESTVIVHGPGSWDVGLWGRMDGGHPPLDLRCEGCARSGGKGQTGQHPAHTDFRGEEGRRVDRKPTSLKDLILNCGREAFASLLVSAGIQVAVEGDGDARGRRHASRGAAGPFPKDYLIRKRNSPSDGRHA